MPNPSVDTSETIAIDAYTGDAPVVGHFAREYRGWALVQPRYGKPVMRPPELDLAQWRDDRVGWGLILPDRDDRTAEQLAGAGDAPDPIQRLLAHRNGKVLRYRAGTQFGDWTLRDYGGGGDLLNAASPMGTAARQLPQYLLIYATPLEVPWRIQYALNPVRFVGRLDLTGEALDNYVEALLSDWNDSQASYARPVVWAVDHGGGDITALMRDVVAEPVYERLHGDPEMTGATFVDGRATAATGGRLHDALAANQPSLVVTSSHGMTGPLSDLATMHANLGLPVDASHQIIAAATLLDGWRPDGAIWFAQACCSAGSDCPTAYTGLFESGSLLDQTLTGIAQAGASIAPLPRALLGCDKPLRAFVGHVEPTFSWTLSFPPNRQALSADLTRALHDGVCSGKPVGLAMSAYYPAIGSLLVSYTAAREDYNGLVGAEAKPSLDMLVYSRVTAHDRASTVILGDPTAAIPLPQR
ncbi:hypothetical protein ORI20_12910 [Mycobacterium sp. CVI_P3]|uniref:Uncharacterized protein n=1 Tax=Mycobacterium pinniadriaticum TaxID=2994102 RepID=A0ABT3SDJ9_9MYCO|nr:hypothetical protein [Mycobacterium pinniadriaticum]MCX2931183.1 hypothetical protein [Mycobacterium pinniadriaticum]MCX2937593.1 hypothetical protein [Mycobacterium pinniadriaticum]